MIGSSSPASGATSSPISPLSTISKSAVQAARTYWGRVMCVPSAKRAVSARRPLCMSSEKLQLRRAFTGSKRFSPQYPSSAAAKIVCTRLQRRRALKGLKSKLMRCWRSSSEKPSRREFRMPRWKATIVDRQLTFVRCGARR